MTNPESTIIPFIRKMLRESSLPNPIYSEMYKFGTMITFIKFGVNEYKVPCITIITQDMQYPLAFVYKMERSVFDSEADPMFIKEDENINYNYGFVFTEYLYNITLDFIKRVMANVRTYWVQYKGTNGYEDTIGSVIDASGLHGLHNASTKIRMYPIFDESVGTIYLEKTDKPIFVNTNMNVTEFVRVLNNLGIANPEIPVKG